MGKGRPSKGKGGGKGGVSQASNELDELVVESMDVSEKMGQFEGLSDNTFKSVRNRLEKVCSTLRTEQCFDKAAEGLPMIANLENWQKAVKLAQNVKHTQRKSSKLDEFLQMWPLVTQENNYKAWEPLWVLYFNGLVRYSLPAFDQACQQISYNTFMNKVSAECAEQAEVTCGELVLEHMMVDAEGKTKTTKKGDKSDDLGKFLVPHLEVLLKHAKLSPVNAPRVETLLSFISLTPHDGFCTLTDQIEDIENSEATPFFRVLKSHHGCYLQLRARATERNLLLMKMETGFEKLRQIRRWTLTFTEGMTGPGTEVFTADPLSWFVDDENLTMMEEWFCVLADLGPKSDGCEEEINTTEQQTDAQQLARELFAILQRMLTSAFVKGGERFSEVLKQMMDEQREESVDTEVITEMQKIENLLKFLGSDAFHSLCTLCGVAVPLAMKTTLVGRFFTFMNLLNDLMQELQCPNLHELSSITYDAMDLEVRDGSGLVRSKGQLIWEVAKAWLSFSQGEVPNPTAVPLPARLNFCGAEGITEFKEALQATLFVSFHNILRDHTQVIDHELMVNSKAFKLIMGDNFTGFLPPEDKKLKELLESDELSSGSWTTFSAYGAFFDTLSRSVDTFQQFEDQIIGAAHNDLQIVALRFIQNFQQNTAAPGHVDRIRNTYNLLSHHGPRVVEAIRTLAEYTEKNPQLTTKLAKAKDFVAVHLKKVIEGWLGDMKIALNSMMANIPSHWEALILNQNISKLQAEVLDVTMQDAVADCTDLIEPCLDYFNKHIMKWLETDPNYVPQTSMKLALVNAGYLAKLKTFWVNSLGVNMALNILPTRSTRAQRGATVREFSAQIQIYISHPLKAFATLIPSTVHRPS